jgi:hypothetical protein
MENSSLRIVAIRTRIRSKEGPVFLATNQAERHRSNYQQDLIVGTFAEKSFQKFCHFFETDPTDCPIEEFPNLPIESFRLY